MLTTSEVLNKQMDEWMESRQNWGSYAAVAATKSLQSCLTLCDPIDSSPPGSCAPGILWARTLEWVAISFYRHLLFCDGSRIST